MNKCFRKRNRNECESQHYCRGWMQVMQINASQRCTKTTTKNNNRETKSHPNLPDVWAKISFGQDFILNWLNGKCCYPVSIQTKWPFNALNLCSYALCNTTWPSWHSVNSTTNASLPEAQSQGKGHGSMANGLFDADISGVCILQTGHFRNYRM